MKIILASQTLLQGLRNQELQAPLRSHFENH